MYRNWPEICKIGKENRLLMILLSTVDLESKIGKSLSTAFPGCFLETRTGKELFYSLSDLRAEAKGLHAQLHPDEEAVDRMLVTHDVLTPHDIPHISFSSLFVDNVPDLPLPEDIRQDAEVGDVFNYGSGFGVGKWVVVENNGGFLAIAPGECVFPVSWD
ncbi:MAG: hypothetical protein AAB534_03535 [Patescibacteria group bacterium]